MAVDVTSSPAFHARTPSLLSGDSGQQQWPCMGCLLRRQTNSLNIRQARQRYLPLEHIFFAATLDTGSHRPRHELIESDVRGAHDNLCLRQPDSREGRLLAYGLVACAAVGFVPLTA